MDGLNWSTREKSGRSHRRDEGVLLRSCRIKRATVQENVKLECIFVDPVTERQISTRFTSFLPEIYIYILYHAFSFYSIFSSNNFSVYIFFTLNIYSRIFNFIQLTSIRNKKYINKKYNVMMKDLKWMWKIFYQFNQFILWYNKFIWV